MPESAEVLAERLRALDARVESMRQDIDKLEEQKTKNLKWGVSVLGAVCVALFGVLWNTVRGKLGL